MGELVDRLLALKVEDETALEREQSVQRAVQQFQGIMTKKTNAVLIARFKAGVGSDGNVEHRLIAKGRHTAGYEDEYFIDVKSEDDLGGERWDRRASWRASADNLDDSTKTMLVAALKAAQRESRGAVVDAVAKFIGDAADKIEDVATRAALIAIADAVREGRPFQQ